RNGAPKCSPTANPAEYILDVVGSRNAAIDWPQVWRESPESGATIAEISRINQIKEAVGTDNSYESDNLVYARSHMYQIRVVTRRMFLSYWRNTNYNLARLAMQILSALIVGFTFYKLNDGTADLRNKAFVLFQSAILSTTIINQVQPEFSRQRQYYSRETSTNQYGWRAFAFAVIVTEWPFSFVANSAFFVAFYWTVGLNGISDRVGYFYVAYVVHGVFSITLGQAIGAFSPNDLIAAVINPIFTSMFIMFGGVAVPYHQIPNFWRSWMYWLSPYRYFVEGTITNELHGSQIRCRPDEFFTFAPPSNQTCVEYAGSWISRVAGYISNPESTTNCEYCEYSVGDDYYSSLGWSFGNRWRNIGILLGFIAFNVVFTALMIKIYKVNKR
ncbi:ATP-binding cassette transporter snq2, partial [Coemansia sp. RSA 2611]